MTKTGKIALAVAAAGLFTGALTATAPAASAQPTEFTTLVSSEKYGNFLHPGPGDDVTLGDSSEWTFQEVAPGTYEIRAANRPGAPCITSFGQGDAVKLAECGFPFGNQTWKLQPAKPGQTEPVLIEAAGHPGEVLEPHGVGEKVTLEPLNGDVAQQWKVYGR
ncbi:RICIN domain-containing protein [Kitasatospora sp. NPDC048286]|uniref:RICIN domain-containing protein n=1 Tax=unclassified Kitasatospora TaxID=2633591 RepID=UPI00371AF301